MKLNHTSITVKDLNESLDFYTKKLGLQLLSRREIKENNAEIAFIGDGQTEHRIELTWWRNKKDYAEGDQLDHIAFLVDDVKLTIEEMGAKGVKIAKEPYTLKGGTSIIAFIQDPNGIWIELIQRR